MAAEIACILAMSKSNNQLTKRDKGITMFKGHNIITVDDEGVFIAELHRATLQPVDKIIEDDFEQLLRDSEKVAIRSQN